jgi:hypothetical protein
MLLTLAVGLCKIFTVWSKNKQKYGYSFTERRLESGCASNGGHQLVTAAGSQDRRQQIDGAGLGVYIARSTAGPKGLELLAGWACAALAEFKGGEKKK